MVDTRAVHLLSHPEVVLCSSCLDWLVAQRERRTAGHGSAVRVLGAEAMLAVADLALALDHYRRLGFTVASAADTAAVVERDGQVIHLVERESADGEAVFLRVDDADELASSWRMAGLEVYGPDDTGAGACSGWHRDPDGHRIRFASPSPSP